MAKLRGKKPEDRKQRLKLLLSGPAGVGKTTAAIQMPRPYLIDTEAGSVHYGDIIEKSGGAVFESSDIDDVIAEVRTLYTEQHDFLTLVIDPVTTLFNAAVDEAEKRVGTDFGAHYREANKKFKRLFALIATIDMNVVITTHSKAEYENTVNAQGKTEMTKVGETYDGPKGVDYVFDLWLQLNRERGKTERTAFVRKSRIADAFADQSEFPWSYAEVAKRYGAERLEKGTAPQALADESQAALFNRLMSRLTDDEQKTLKIPGIIKKYGEPVDWSADVMAKTIDLIEKHMAAGEPVAA